MVQRLQIKAGEHTGQSPFGFGGDGWWPQFSRLRGPAPPAPVLLPLPMPDMSHSGLGSRVMWGHIKPQTESSARSVFRSVRWLCFSQSSSQSHLIVLTYRMFVDSASLGAQAPGSHLLTITPRIRQFTCMPQSLICKMVLTNSTDINQVQLE